MAIFEPIFGALNQANVRYVVVGGLAVVLQGHARLTVDIDLVIDLATHEVDKAIAALTSLGFVPRIPVDVHEFANPESRRRWQREKHMQVFPLIDPSDPLRAIDVFVEPPVDFAGLYDRADILPLGRTTVRVACLEDLIAMKRRAGRAKDLLDIEVLEEIRVERRRSTR